MEGVGKCIEVWGEVIKGKCVGEVGSVWGMGVGEWKCVWGVGKCAWGVGKCAWDVGRDVERVLGWGQCGGCGEVWGEGWCHDLKPQLS